MRKHIPFLLALLGLVLPAIAGNSDGALRKNLAQIDQLIKANTINLKELYAKRSAILKKLGGDKGKTAQPKKPGPDAATNKAKYAKKKYKALKAKKDAIAKKKAAAAKQSGIKKPTKKKEPAKSTKSSKTSSAIHKKAEASRAKFLKRFDQNRDGKVTKDEAKSVLAAEAKARAIGREKKKKK